MLLLREKFNLNAICANAACPFGPLCSVANQRFVWNGTSLTPNMNKTVAVELYDHRTDLGDDFDAYDQVNLATDPDFAAAVAAGAAIVRAGWRAQLPP